MCVSISPGKAEIMFNKLFCAAAICLCLSVCVEAQQNAADAPASKEDVERYLQAMHYKDMMDKVVDAMSKPMHEMIHQQFLKEQGKLPADFEARMTKRMDEMLKTFPWDEIMDAMIPVYQKHFTRGDIDAMVAFYETPTGQKLLRELPEITAESMQQMMPLLQKNMEAMNKGIQEDIAAMLKESQPKIDPDPPQKNK
jgi:uncharacterized protein